MVEQNRLTWNEEEIPFSAWCFGETTPPPMRYVKDQFLGEWRAAGPAEKADFEVQKDHITQTIKFEVPLRVMVSFDKGARGSLRLTVNSPPDKPFEIAGTAIVTSLDAQNQKASVSFLVTDEAALISLL